MIISKETLLTQAAASGFRPEILEKVFHLMSLLNGFNRHPFLKGRLALKGGTALNLFIFDLPRLSVDIDLNYVGSPDRNVMLSERSKVEQAITAVCEREGLEVNHVHRSHAAFGFRLRYRSALGGGGDLKVDLNFIIRTPLWPLAERTSREVGSYPRTTFPVLDTHELAGGKLAALLARQTGRDLFDAHILLSDGRLDQDRLRLAFVLYGAMNANDWKVVQASDVRLTAKELREQLVPVLRADLLQEEESTALWAEKLVNETREFIGWLLPLTEAEIEFLDRIRDKGQIEGSLLTEDEAMIKLINGHPALLWRVQRALEERQT